MESQDETKKNQSTAIARKLGRIEHFKRKNAMLSNIAA